MSINIKRWICFILGLAPGAYLLYRALTDHLGIDPYETLIRDSGDYTIWALIISLAITPLMFFKKLTKLQIAIYRLPIGMLAFFYATVHFFIFFGLETQFDLNEVAKATGEKPYVFAGMASFFILILLAVTTIPYFKRKMGGKKWKWLHRAVYIAMLAAVLHYFWLGKYILWVHWLVAGLVAVFLGYRLYVAIKRKRKFAR